MRFYEDLVVTSNDNLRCQIYHSGGCSSRQLKSSYSWSHNFSMPILDDGAYPR